MLPEFIRCTCVFSLRLSLPRLFLLRLSFTPAFLYSGLDIFQYNGLMLVKAKAEKPFEQGNKNLGCRRFKEGKRVKYPGFGH
jgi:hypothetical protein